MITLTQEEAELIINTLAEFPAKYTYNCIQLLSEKIKNEKTNLTTTNPPSSE